MHVRPCLSTCPSMPSTEKNKLSEPLLAYVNFLNLYLHLCCCSAQQCNEIFIKKHGLAAIAFHGDVGSHQMNTWNKARLVTFPSHNNNNDCYSCYATSCCSSGFGCMFEYYCCYLSSYGCLQQELFFSCLSLFFCI